MRTLSQAVANLCLVFPQQIGDELLSRISRNLLGGYIRLNADGEITACFTGPCAYLSATSR